MWARLYSNPDPLAINNPAFEGVEIPWELAAVNELLDAAFPGKWATTAVAMNMALILDPTPYLTRELQTSSPTGKYPGYVWVRTSDQPTLKHKPKKDDLPVYEDRITAALVRDGLKTHGKAYCPDCRSKDLQMFKLALRCTRCRKIVGGI